MATPGVVLLALFAAFLQLCRGRLVQSTTTRRSGRCSGAYRFALDCHRGGLVMAEFGRQP